VGTHRTVDPEPASDDEGGDPACWAQLVCPACGRLTEDPAARRCPACGAELPDR
jgi:rubrerythrin